MHSTSLTERLSPSSKTPHLLQCVDAQVEERPLALFNSLKAALQVSSQPGIPFTRHRQPTANASRLHHRIFSLHAHMPDIVRQMHPESESAANSASPAWRTGGSGCPQLSLLVPAHSRHFVARSLI